MATATLDGPHDLATEDGMGIATPGLGPLTDGQRRLVEANTGLVGGHMKRNWWAWWVVKYHRDYDEGFSAGLLGLVEAARRFRPEMVSRRTGRPIKFSTYADYWIKGHLQGRDKNAGMAMARLGARTLDLGVDDLDITEDRRHGRPEDGVDAREAAEVALAGLGEREREVLRLRAQGLTLRAVGAALDPPVTRERVRQVERRAVVEARRLAALRSG